MSLSKGSGRIYPERLREQRIFARRADIHGVIAGRDGEAAFAVAPDRQRVIGGIWVDDDPDLLTGARLDLHLLEPDQPLRRLIRGRGKPEVDLYDLGSSYRSGVAHRRADGDRSRAWAATWI